MKLFEFQSRLWLPCPLAEVFEFFSDATNLETITPPWLQFQVTTPQPIDMHEGVEIAYRLKVHGFPIRWRSRITVWDPPHRFVDEQISGPYRVWHHEHTFHEESGGTACEDHVKYAAIGGAIINKLFVERDVKKIFAYRSARLLEIFK